MRVEQKALERRKQQKLTSEQTRTDVETRQNSDATDPNQKDWNRYNFWIRENSVVLPDSVNNAKYKE